MRKFLLLTVLILTSCNLNAQQHFWIGGKKLQLEVDSTELIVATKNEADKSNLKNYFSSEKVRFDTEDRMGNFMRINITPEGNKKDIILSVRKHTNVEEVFISYKVGNSRIVPTNEIVLKPKSGIGVESILTKYFRSVEKYRQAGHNYYVLTLKKGKDVFDIANAIYEEGSVEWCHPNYWQDIEKYQVDPFYASQYYLNNTGQTGGLANIDINAPEAWAITKGLRAVRVAVVDDGVESHEDIAGRVLSGYSSSNSNGTVNGSPITVPSNLSNQVGHGQACAGIIAATHNNLGIAGIAPCVNIIPVNIFNQYSVSAGGAIRFTNTVLQQAEAIDWAWSPSGGNADVLSNSWGYQTSNSGEIINSSVLTQAIENAITLGRGGKGTLVVFASGNGYNGLDAVKYPSNVSGVFTVGAIDKSGQIQIYSDRGPEMDLVAPSGLTSSLGGGDVYTTDRTGTEGYSPNNYFAGFGGTSAACPQVSAVAALMLSINPNLTATEVGNILRSSATDMGPAGFDNTFGSGRLNAQAALQQVIPTVTGATLICTANSNYSMNFVPPDNSISWQATPSSLFAASSGSGSTASLRAASTNTSGQGTVTFTVASSCSQGSPLTISKTVWVGKPAMPDYSGALVVYPHQQYTYYSTSGANDNTNSYSWTMSPTVGNCGTTYGGNCIVGAGTPYNSITIWWEQSGFLEARSVNSCGQSAARRNNILVTEPGGGGGGCEPCQRGSGKSDSTATAQPKSDNKEIIEPDYLWAVYPNPSKDMFEIIVNEPISIDNPLMFTVYDNLGRKLRNVYTTESKFNIDLGDSPQGIYHLSTVLNGQRFHIRLLKM